MEKMPPLIFHNKWFRWLFNREKILFISLIYTYYSYFYASYFNEPSLITASGVIITVFGLLLTLKHNFISDSLDLRIAFDKFHHKAGPLEYEGELDSPTLVNPVISAVKDEYSGVLLIILGSVIGAYGNLVPLIEAT